MKYGIAFDHCHIYHEHHVSLIIKTGWVIFLIYIYYINICYKIKRQERFNNKIYKLSCHVSIINNIIITKIFEDSLLLYKN